MKESNRGLGRQLLRYAATAAVLVILFAAPMAAGFQYRILPLALWEFGKQPLSVSNERVRGQNVTVDSGEMILCGFFELVRR